MEAAGKFDHTGRSWNVVQHQLIKPIHPDVKWAQEGSLDSNWRYCKAII